MTAFAYIWEAFFVLVILLVAYVVIAMYLPVRGTPKDHALRPDCKCRACSRQRELEQAIGFFGGRQK